MWIGKNFSYIYEMSTITDEQFKEIVSKIVEWHKHYSLVRVIERTDGMLVAKKIALIDGNEEDYGVEYQIETYDNIPLPIAGDYPSNLFEDQLIAANVYPADYAGEYKAHVRRDVIVYLAEPLNT